MSQTSTLKEKYENDPRVPCRYGGKCYQKNSEHHKNYKHPPKKGKRKFNIMAIPAKRPKLDESPKQDEDSGNSNSSIGTNSDKKEVRSVQKNECISPSGSEEESNETISDQKETDVETVEKKECLSPSSSEESHEPKKELQPTAERNSDDKISETEKNKDTESETLLEGTGINFDPKSFMKSRFLIEPPSDFYDFWDFCKELKPSNPSEALKDVGLKLVGPYDVLSGKFKHIKRSPDDYLRHYRYYYDPPELFTVLKGDNKTGYHIGYFYDSPNEPPVFLVSNYGLKDGVLTKMGDNIFAAVHIYLEELKKIGDPFKKMHVGRILNSLKTKCEKLNCKLSPHSEKIKKREMKVVARTFNKIGLVVPYIKKTQLGYRDLAMEDKDLMTLLNKLQKASPEQKSKYLSDLQPVLTYASIALDECDFGTGVKLGWELLYHGIDSLNSTIAQFLSNSYRLLNKEAFAKIAEAHMNKRKKGCDLSIV